MDAVEAPYDDAPPHEGEASRSDAGNAFAPRQAPRNIEAEAGLLGAVFIDNRCLEACEDQGLSPDDFYLPAHRMIYAACLQLWRGGSIADPTTLRPHFEDADELKEIGGAAYLGNLVVNAVSTFNAKEYARIVVNEAGKRRLIEIAEQIHQSVYDADLDTPAARLIEEAERELFDFGATTQTGGGPRHIAVFVDEFLEHAEAARKGERVGIKTGLDDLDRILGGLHPTDLIIVAGRPGSGKSALGSNICMRCGVPALGFDLEMSGEQKAGREVSAKCSLSTFQAYNGYIDDYQMDRLRGAGDDFRQAPVWIDDSPSQTVARMRSIARRWARKNPGGLIVIDYLQLIEGARQNRSDGRVQEVTAITRGLKMMAKELRMPVIALSQLSRQVENRENKRPQLSDLRESGSIEQDAEVVIFIYREEMYLRNEEPQQPGPDSDEKVKAKYAAWSAKMEKAKNVAEAIVAKNRHGPIATAKLQFDPETTQFRNLSKWG